MDGHCFIVHLHNYQSDQRDQLFASKDEYDYSSYVYLPSQLFSTFHLYIPTNKSFQRQTAFGLSGLGSLPLPGFFLVWLGGPLALPPLTLPPCWLLPGSLLAALSMKTTCSFEKAGEGSPRLRRAVSYLDVVSRVFLSGDLLRCLGGEAFGLLGVGMPMEGPFLEGAEELREGREAAQRRRASARAAAAA